MKISYAIISTFLILSSFTFSEEGVKNVISVAKSSSVKSGIQLQVLSKVTLKGVKLDVATGELLFGDNFTEKLPNSLSLSGGLATAQTEALYNNGIKVSVKPTIDFIQGNILCSGTIEVFEGKIKFEKPLDEYESKFEEDVKSWKKLWRSRGNKSMKMKVKGEHIVTISVDLSIVDHKGKSVNLLE